MEKFIKENWKKVLGVVVLVLIIILISSNSSRNSATENNPDATKITSQAKDFFNKYNLYYFDNTSSLTKNGEKIENGGDKFTPNVLYSDGVFLSSYNGVLDKVERGQGTISDVVDSSASMNDYKLFFQGNFYDSYVDSDSVLRDKNFIFYTKCLKIEYIKKSNGNRCVNTALFSNNDKVDEGGRPDDVSISIGMGNVDLLFVKDGILYYAKTAGETYNYYSYNPISKKVALYKPELFSNKENDLLGIFNDGGIIFRDSNGIFKNNSQSKIVDSAQTGDTFLIGGAFGNSYYYFDTKYDQKNSAGGHGFFKDNLLIAQIRSNVYGRIIDADKQDCNLGSYIYTAYTPMYCINKTGTIVRLDSNEKRNTNDPRGTNKQEDNDVSYFINNDVVNPNYWIKGTKSVKSTSFIFDDNGNISYLVISATDENSYISNIYLAPYLGDGRIGEPKILISNASLFGVSKK